MRRAEEEEEEESRRGPLPELDPPPPSHPHSHPPLLPDMLRHTLPVAAFAAASLAFAEETTLPLGGGADLTVVRIEPGLFQQGSHEGETGRVPDETRHYVSISRAFYLGKSPVTRGQFARFVSDTNYQTEAEKGSSGGFGYENGKLEQRKEYTWRTPGFSQTDNDPVVIVTWNDA